MLSLLTLLLAGSVEAVLRAQERQALQARLDLCALRLALRRERLLAQLVPLNQALQLTVLALYAARGAMVATGGTGMILGAGGERLLLAKNRALAQAQNVVIGRAAAAELRDLSCAPTPFSRGPALCAASPALPLAFRRDRALFPDISGTLASRGRSRELASIRCQGSRGLSTRLLVHGDGALRTNGFSDSYAQ